MNLTINNRELLRNYKDIKCKLLQQKVKLVRVEQGDGLTLEIRLKKEKTYQTAFEKSLELIKKHPIKIKRPEADLFDYI